MASGRAPMPPGAQAVLVSHIVPSCSADALTPPRPTNHRPAAGPLDQSQPGDNIEAGPLDQWEAGQQTEHTEATSCTGLSPPGPRDPDVSLDGSLPANQSAGLRPGDQ